MAFYFDTIRPLKRQSSSNDITTDHSAFLWHCMNQWCDLLGPDVVEMSCDFDAIASDVSPAIGMILKGPKPDIDAAHPISFAIDLGTTYFYTYQRYDFQKGSNVTGSFSSQERLVLDSRSDASYYNGKRTVECYWSDTPGCRYFIFNSILGVYGGIHEVPVLNENINGYDDQNVRWMFWASNSIYYNMFDNTTWTDLIAKARKYDIYGKMLWRRVPMDPWRIGDNLPLLNAANLAVGHMKDQLVCKGNEDANQLIKKDNKYYYCPAQSYVMWRVA